MLSLLTLSTTIILLIVVIILTRELLIMKKKLHDLSNFIYVLMKRYESIDTSCDDIKHAMNTVNSNLKVVDENINDNIRSLSSSTDKVLEQYKTMSSKSYLPTPNISKMIRDTILENINIEVLLSHNMKLPNKQSTQHIIDNTIKTYPNVDKEYVIKLCLAMIENFVLDSTGK